MIVAADTVYAEQFGSLQEAIDATPKYGTLKLPAGIFTAPTAAGWSITKPITIEGNGRPAPYEGIPSPEVADASAAWTSGTILRPYSTADTNLGALNSTVLHIKGPITNVVIKNLGIEHPFIPPTTYPVAFGTGHGIDIDATTGYVGFVTISHVCVRFMGGDGIYLHGNYPSGNDVDQCNLNDVQCLNNRRHGVYAYRTFDVRYDNVLAVGNQQCGMALYDSFNQELYHTLFNGNGRSFVRTGTDWLGTAQGWPYYNQAQLCLTGVSGFLIDAADVEQWAGSDPGTGWVLAQVPHGIELADCRFGEVRGCSTYNSGYVAGALDSVFIYVQPLCEAISFRDNHAGDCSYALFAMNASNIRGLDIGAFYIVSAGAAACTTYISNELDTATNANCGNIVWPAIGASDRPTFRSAIAGLRLPLVTTNATGTASGTNVTPVEGLLSYDGTLKTLRIYNGTAWKTVTVT